MHIDDNEVAPGERVGLKQVHPVTSEQDIRQKLQLAPNTMTLPKATARQQVILSREKSLPPYWEKRTPGCRLLEAIPCNALLM